jgi:hypothetical protein
MILPELAARVRAFLDKAGNFATTGPLALCAGIGRICKILIFSEET